LQPLPLAVSISRGITASNPKLAYLVWQAGRFAFFTALAKPDFSNRKRASSLGSVIGPAI
jgi:hypothetical protein